MRGRVGYYAPGLVDRISAIQKLHAEGFTLDLIGRMLDAGGEAGDDVMRLAGALRAPFRDEGPPAFDLGQWAEIWGPTAEDDLARALELGLVRERPDGRLEFTSTRAASIGATLRSLGLSPDQILDATAEIRAHADGIALLFERVWMDHIWQPLLDEGMPSERLAGVERLLADVQPLALDAVVAIFTVAMESRIEQGIAHELERATAEQQQRRRR